MQLPIAACNPRPSPTRFEVARFDVLRAKGPTIYLAQAKAWARQTNWPSALNTIAQLQNSRVGLGNGY